MPLSKKAFRDGLRDLGYVDGTNVIMIVRYSNGDPAKYRDIIRELIALRVDVLLGDAPVLKEATTTIPIVSATMSDPVRTGLVASLARPGGNLTGLSSQRYDIDQKLLARAVGVSVCMIPVRTLDDIRAVPGIIAQQRPQAALI